MKSCRIVTYHQVSFPHDLQPSYTDQFDPCFGVMDRLDGLENSQDLERSGKSDGRICKGYQCVWYFGELDKCDLADKVSFTRYKLLYNFKANK